jgi:O-antigen ligase
VEFAFTHENGVLVSLLLTVCVTWVIWGPNKLQRLAALVVAIFASMLLLTMRRRAGMLVAEAGLLTIGLVLLVKNWRMFLMVAPVVTVGCVLYLGAFWNNPNSLGQPARAFRSVFDEESLSARDQASDDYRTVETTNVWWNIQARPLRGLGFGHPYPKPLPFPDLSQLWPFWPYISHNTILWVWMKAGVVAFVALWFLLGTAVTQIAHVIRRARDPTIVTFGTGALACIVMLSMFSYVDLGLVSPRLMILLGATIGLIPVLQRFVEEGEEKLAAGTAGGAP